MIYVRTYTKEHYGVAAAAGRSKTILIFIMSEAILDCCLGLSVLNIALIFLTEYSKNVPSRIHEQPAR